MAIHLTVYQLRLAKEHEMIASLYTDLNDPDAFCAGFVEQVSPRYVLLAALNPWGQRDGWLLSRTSDIVQVFYGDEYEVRLDMLLSLRDYKHEPFAPDPEDPELDLLSWFLALAQERGKTLTLMTQEDSYTGKIIQVDDLRVSMNALDFFGRPMLQPTAVRLCDIQAITLDSEEERMFELLSSAGEGKADPHQDPKGGTHS